MRLLALLILLIPLWRPWQFVNAVRHIHADARSMKQDPPDLLRQPAVYAQRLAVVDHYRKGHPGHDPYYDSHLAVMAWMCGLPSECLARLDAAGAKADAQCFQTLGMGAQQLRALAVDAGAEEKQPRIDQV